tara:strand:+ start:160 stop:336 length:177 start_codon:yes stop_codon:yes gene_type:complete
MKEKVMVDIKKNTKNFFIRFLFPKKKMKKIDIKITLIKLDLSPIIKDINIAKIIKKYV